MRKRGTLIIVKCGIKKCKRVGYVNMNSTVMCLMSSGAFTYLNQDV